jgi:nucleoside-diphosphate-sugar epimerase
LTGEVLNVGGGTIISVNELIEKIENVTGKRARVKHLQPQKGDVGETLADTRRARELLGWKPFVDIDSGLKQYLRSC